MIKQSPQTIDQNALQIAKSIGSATEMLIGEVKNLPVPYFSDTILEFNQMYKMPVASLPTLTPGFDVLQRLKDFKKIISDEVAEIDAIIAKVETHGAEAADAMEVNGWFIDLTDLLADIKVYCASEMAKYGIPQDNSLNIVMQSNFSKMGEDGKPIFDETNKLQKGPNYWKPEPRLSVMIKARKAYEEKFATLQTNEEKVEFIQTALANGTLEEMAFGAVLSESKIREMLAKKLKSMFDIAKASDQLIRSE